MGKKFPADTELRIIQKTLTSHEMLQRVMRDGFKYMIKLLGYGRLEQIPDAGLKTSVCDYGLAAGFIQSGTGLAL